MHYIVSRLFEININHTFSLITSFLIWLNIGGTVAINDLNVGVIGGYLVELNLNEEQ